MESIEPSASGPRGDVGDGHGPPLHKLEEKVVLPPSGARKVGEDDDVEPNFTEEELEELIKMEPHPLPVDNPIYMDCLLAYATQPGELAVLIQSIIIILSPCSSAAAVAVSSSLPSLSYHHHYDLHLQSLKL